MKKANGIIGGLLVVLLVGGCATGGFKTKRQLKTQVENDKQMMFMKDQQLTECQTKVRELEEQIADLQNKQMAESQARIQALEKELSDMKGKK